VSVWLRDIYGNSVAPGTLLIQPILTLADVSVPVSIVLPVTSGTGSSGMMQLSFVPTISGKYVLNIRLVHGPELVSGNVFEPCVIAGEPQVELTTMQILNEVLVAGDEFAGFVSAFDKFGNAAAIDMLDVQTTGNGVEGFFRFQNVSYSSSIVLTAPLKLGIYRLVLSLNGQVCQVTVSFQVISGPVDVLASSITLLSSMELRAGSGGRIQVNSYDRHFNPTSPAAVQCRVCADSIASSVQVERASIAATTAVFDFLATRSGSYTICVVVGEQLLGSAVNVIVKSMSPMADSIQISFHRKTRGNSTDQSGIKTIVRVCGSDIFGNPYDLFEDGIAEGALTLVGKEPAAAAVPLVFYGGEGFDFVFQYMATIAGTYDLSIQLGSVFGPAVQTQVLPGQVSVITSVIDAHDPFDANNLVYFTLWIKDSFANNKTVGEHNIQVEILSVPAGAEKPGKTVTDNFDGTYSISATITASGSYMIYLQGFRLDGSREGISMPFTVHPCEVSPVQTQVSGPGVKGAVAGHEASFSIALRDIYGNSVSLDNQEDLQVSFQPPGNKLLTRNSFDQDPSVRIITYRPNSVGQMMMHANVLISNEMVPLDKSPFAVNIIQDAGPLSPTRSYISNRKQNLMVGVQTRIDLLTLNAQGVHLVKGGASFSVALSPVRPSGRDVPVTVVDNSDGSYTASFTVTTSGTFSLSALLGMDSLAGSPKTIDIVPGPTSAALTRVSGAGTKMATAGMPASMLIQARDEYGNPRTEGGDLFGLEVVEKQTGARVRSSVSDLGDGTYSVIYTVTSSGGYGVDLTVSQTVIAMPSTDVMVSPAMAHGPTSVAQGFGLRSAVAGKTSKVSVWLRDIYGNSVAPDDQSLTISFKFADETIPTQTQKNARQTFLYYMATQSGVYMLSLSSYSVQLQGSPFKIVVSNGEVDASKCVADGFGMAQAVAGSVGTFGLFSRDSFLNNVTDGGHSFAVSMMHTPTFSFIFLDAIDTDMGTYAVSYNVTRSGLYYLRITRKQTHIIGSPFAVTIAPDQAAANATKIRGPIATSFTAGVPVSFCINSADRFGNQITQSEVYSVQMQPLQGPHVSYDVTQDVGNGCIDLSFMPTQAGTSDMSVLLYGLPIASMPVHTKVASNTFKRLTSRLPLPKVVALVAGQRPLSSVLLDAWDQFDNFVPGITVDVTYTSNPANEIQIQLLENSNDNYSVRMYATKAGVFSVHLRLNQIFVDPAPFHLKVWPGSADAGVSACSNASSSSLSVVAGSPKNLAVDARDKFGNYILEPLDLTVKRTGRGQIHSQRVLATFIQPGVLRVPFYVTQSAAYILNIFVGMDQIGACPFPLAVVPGQPAVDMSVLSGSGLSRACFAMTATFQVSARDSFGNPTTFFKSGVSLSASFDIAASGVVDSFASSRDGDHIRAEYIIRTTPSTGLWTVNMHLSISRPETLPFKAVGAIQIYSMCDSEISSNESLIVLPEVIITGQTTKITLRALNAQGVHLVKGGASFSVALSPVRPSGRDVPVTVVDNSDGSYTASFTVTTSGTFSLSALLGMDSLAGSPKTIDIVPGPTSAALTRVSGAGTKMATAGMPASMLIQARDEYGNPRTEGGDLFGLEVVEKQTGARVRSSVSDLGDGSYAASYVVTRSGLYEIAVTIVGVRTRVAPSVSRILPASPDASRSTIALIAQAYSTVAVRAGQKISFDINVRDRFTNLIMVSDFVSTAWPSVTVRSPEEPSAPTSLPLQSSGALFVEFSATVAGDYILDVIMGGAAFANSPLTLRVQPTLVDIGSSALVFPDPLMFRADMAATFAIELRDRYHNAVMAADAVYVSVASVAVINTDGVARSVRVNSVVHSSTFLQVRADALQPCAICQLAVSLQANGTTTEIYGSPVPLIVDGGAGPYMVQARFSDDCAEVHIDLSVSSRRQTDSLACTKDMCTPHTCERLFQDNTLKSLGEGARCLFQSNFSLLIRLGSSPSLEFHDPVSLKASAVISLVTSAPAKAHSLMVRPPAHPSRPRVQIEGPTTIRSSDTLVLSAVVLAGSGGRKAELQWSLALGERGSPSIRAILSTANQDKLEVSGRLFDADTAYTFVLIAKNWMGQTAVATQQVYVQRSVLLPILLVPGAPHMLHPNARPLNIQAQVINADLDPATAVTFRWSLIDGPSVPTLRQDVLGKSQLYVPPEELTGISSLLIEVRVTLSMSNTSQVSASQLIHVEMLPPRLQAFIAGGSRTMSQTQTHTLDATASIAGSALGVIFLWACVDDLGKDCFAANSDIAQRMWSTDTSVLTLLSGSLRPGTYTVTLTVIAEPGPRSSSTSVELKVVAGSVPSVFLSSRATMQADGNGWLLVTSALDAGTACSTAPTFGLSVMSIVTPSPSIDVLRIQPFPGGALTRGPFVVRLQVACSTRVGSSSLDISAHWGPSMGAMQVSPWEGSAVSAPFAIVFRNFVAPNDDYPLYFSVYQNLSDPACADCPDEMSLLVSGKQTAYQVVLAPTGHTNASILGVAATASGVTSQSTFMVQLLQHARILSEERPQGVAARKALYAEVQQAISVAMQNLDGQSALQLVVATCSILNNMTLSSSQGHSYQRRLAQSITVAAATFEHSASPNISPSSPTAAEAVHLQTENTDNLSVAHSGLLHIYERVMKWISISEDDLKSNDRPTQKNQSILRNAAHDASLHLPAERTARPQNRPSSSLPLGTVDTDWKTRQVNVNADNVRSYLLGVMQAVSAVSSGSKEDLSSLAVALSLLMQMPGLKATDVTSVVLLLNDIAAGTTSLAAVQDWHSTALVKSAGNVALLLNTHAAALVSEYAALSLQIQDTVGRTAHMLGKALFVGETPRLVRTSQVSLSISKLPCDSTSAHVSRVCLSPQSPVGQTGISAPCVQLVLSQQLIQSCRRQRLRAVGAEVMVVKVTIWKNPLHRMPASYAANTQGPMVQFEISRQDRAGGAVELVEVGKVSMADSLVFQVDSLVTSSDALSLCAWFDSASQEWRQQGLLAMQPHHGALDCLLIARLNHFAVLTQEVVYDTSAMDTDSKIGGFVLGDAREFSSLVSLVLLIVIVTTTLITSCGFGYEAFRIVSLARARTLGASTATNRIAPEDEFVDSVLLEYAKDGAKIQCVLVILLTRHPLLSLLWTAPRAQESFLARVVCFLVTVSGIITLVMLLFAYEFSNAPEWLETGFLAGLVGVPLYLIATAPFGIGRQLRALLKVSKRSTRNAMHPQAQPSLITPVVQSQEITLIAVPSAPTLAQRRASAQPARARTSVGSLDVARAVSGRSEEEEQLTGEEPYWRQGAAGRTMSPQVPEEQDWPYRNVGDAGSSGVTVTAPFTYAPGASTPIPPMPTTISSMSPGGDGLASTKPTLPDAGELPSSMFKEYDLLSVAAHKLNEHQSKRATRDGSISPVRELRHSDVDLTYTPCHSPRDPNPSGRQGRAGSRRTSGRSTPVTATTGARTYRSTASRTAGAALALAGPFGGASLRSVPYAEDGRLRRPVSLASHASAASNLSSAQLPPRFGNRVAGGNFGLRITDLVIPPAPPPSPRNDHVRASAAMVGMDTSPTLQADSDFLQYYQPPEEDAGGDRVQEVLQDTAHVTSPSVPKDHASPSLPGRVEDEPEAPTVTLNTVTSSPHFPNTNTSPIGRSERMSPGELDWSRYIAPSREFPVTSVDYLVDSPQSSPFTKLAARRLRVSARSPAAAGSPEDPVGRGPMSRSRRRDRVPPRPRNLEPILGSPSRPPAWQLQSIMSANSPTRGLSTIPQEEEEIDHSIKAVSVERQAVRNAASISLAPESRGRRLLALLPLPPLQPSAQHKALVHRARLLLVREPCSCPVVLWLCCVPSPVKSWCWTRHLPTSSLTSPLVCHAPLNVARPEDVPGSRKRPRWWHPQRFLQSTMARASNAGQWGRQIAHWMQPSTRGSHAHAHELARQAALHADVQGARSRRRFRDSSPWPRWR
jgi:hypothetical protein